MKEYSKLMRINYRNKLFDIYVDDNHKKTFLEVIKDGSTEKYYHPTLEDTVRLNLIYNNSPININNKKYTFKDNPISNLKIAVNAIKSITIAIGFSGVIIGTAVFADKLLDINNQQVVQEEVHDDLSKLAISEKVVDIPQIINQEETIEYLVVEPATMEDALNSLNENPYLADFEKQRIEAYIMCLNEKLPEVDYSILNANLKDLRIVVNEPVLSGSNVRGEYDSLTNELLFQTEEDYNSDDIFCHEATHALTERISHGKYIGFRGINNYGKSIVEARTELVAMYLINPDVMTFDEYLDAPTRETIAYNGTLTQTTFNLMKLTKNDFTVYDYLFNNVYEYKKVLDKYELTEMIDCLDAELDNYHNGLKIESSLLEDYQSKLTRLVVINQKKEEEANIPVAAYFDPVTYENIPIKFK